MQPTPHDSQTQVWSSRRTLPVLRSADVLVVGGGFAGIAAALEYGRSGYLVVVVEPRTYLGREATATLRPWMLLPKDGGAGHL